MSQIFLIPIDDSDIAMHPVDWLLHNLGEWREVPTVHLLNVQTALPADVSRFINADTIRDFHRENGMKALTPAKEKLAAVGVNAENHILIGSAGQTIADFARDKGCTQILLGTRGQTGFTGTLLGSVAAKVVHLSRVPVTLVR